MTRRNTRLLWVGILFAVSVILTGIYVLRHAEGGSGLPCPLLLLTGWKCPGCGMTRAAASLPAGEFSTAFSYNALWPLYAAYVLWVAVADAVCYVRRGELRILPRPRWIHGAVAVLALGYGVLRNLL